MSLFLDDNEVKRLTGYSRPSAQRRWLLDHGWPHEVNGLGRPLLLTSVVQTRLGEAVKPSKNKLNWDAVNG